MSLRRCDVVIATRNRPAALATCLQSLSTQTVRDLGVVIVDDCSDEPLDAAVAPFVDRFASFTLIRLDEPSGPAVARNRGVEAVEATYVVFIDDDIVADSHLVEAHLSEVTEGGDGQLPVATRGPFLEPLDWDPTPWSLWEARMADKGTRALIRGDYAPTWRQFHTGNNCLSVRLFREVGGFDPSYKRMEDDEFGVRLHVHGCEFRFIPSALAWHYSSRSLDAWLSIPREYGYYTVMLDQAYPEYRFLEQRKGEFDGSNPLLKLARWLFRGPRRSRFGVNLATGLGRAAHRVGATPVTVSAFSVAYDLTLVESVRQAERNGLAVPPRRVVA